MAVYNNFKLTDGGRKLLSALSDGGGGLEFHYLVIGAGVYGPEEKDSGYLQKSQYLKDERQRVSFAFIDRKDDGSVALKANVSNSGLKEGYYMTEIGIYAGIKGSEDKVLYCITLTDNPDYMPEGSSEKPFSVIFNIAVGIGDADIVSISYDAKTFALAEDLHNEITRAIEKETELDTAKLDKDGDASNVTTTFTQAESRENIESNEVLSVIMGKIKKFFADLKTVAFSGSYNDLSNKPTSMKNPSALTIQLNGTSQGAYDGSAEKTINITPSEIGLGNINNTSDMNKPVSAAQQAALDAYYQQSTGYTDQKIAGLINGAPSTLDTLGEIANAMADNADVVEALEEAVGKKASAAEFDSHAKDKTVHITAAERQNWNDPAVSFTQASSRTNIGTDEKLSVILGKIKKFFADLKTVAFSGSYNDLSNKPTSMKNPSALTIQLNGTSQGAYDGSAEKTINITPSEIGLGNINNTSDMNKPVSAAQQTALDAYYQQSTGYTDQKIAGLINGAPSTLDTLGEIAQAMQDNESVVDALEDAIGKKASAAEFDSHVKDKNVHITAAERQNWNDPAVSFTQASSRTNIGTDEKLSVILGKIKKFFADLKTVAFSGSYNDLSNKPTSMKNPSALTIQLNGTSQGAYDGSAAKTVNITPGSIGAAPYSVVANGDFNDLTTPGMYTMRSAYKNKPDAGEYYGIIVLKSDNGDYVEQIAFEEDSYNIYIRSLNGDEWSDWKKISNLSPSDIGALPEGGTAAAATKWATARNINGMKIDGTANRANYGTCGAAGATVQKTVACTGFELITGAEITVRFLSNNAASNPTLNVNNTGAKPIYYHGYAIPAEFLTSWRTYTFRYNGSQYDFVGDAVGSTDISSIGDGSVTGAIYSLHNNFRHIGTGANISFVNVYTGIIDSEKLQVFYVPTYGKTFVGLQFLMGSIVMPDSNIEALQWDTAGIVTLTKSYAGAYKSWEFFVYYLLI